MSKTTEIQIEKSRNLIEGLRRHVREMGERGVSNNEINEMEKTVAMLSEANAEVDRLREELTPKVKKMNDLMVLVKASYAESKKTLKFIRSDSCRSFLHKWPTELASQAFLINQSTKGIDILTITSAVCRQRKHCLRPYQAGYRCDELGQT